MPDLPIAPDLTTGKPLIQPIEGNLLDSPVKMRSDEAKELFEELAVIKQRLTHIEDVIWVLDFGLIMKKNGNNNY